MANMVVMTLAIGTKLIKSVSVPSGTSYQIATVTAARKAPHWVRYTASVGGRYDVAVRHHESGDFDDDWRVMAEADKALVMAARERSKIFSAAQVKLESGGLSKLTTEQLQTLTSWME